MEDENVFFREEWTNELDQNGERLGIWLQPNRLNHTQAVCIICPQSPTISISNIKRNQGKLEHIFRHSRTKEHAHAMAIRKEGNEKKCLFKKTWLDKVGKNGEKFISWLQPNPQNDNQALCTICPWSKPMDIKCGVKNVIQHSKTKRHLHACNILKKAKPPQVGKNVLIKSKKNIAGNWGCEGVYKHSTIRDGLL